MKILWVDIDHTSTDEVLAQIEEAIVDRYPLCIFTPNPEILLSAYHDDSYRDAIEYADTRLADGIGIFIAYQIADFRGPKIFRYLFLPYWCLVAVFAEWHLHKCYGERITGSDLTKEVLMIAESSGTPVVVLDRAVTDVRTAWDQAKLEHQSQMTESLSSRYPGIDVRLVTDDQVSDESFPTGPYILLCTVGGVDQEKLVASLMSRDKNIVLGMGVGGSIDIITGFREQAPRWLRKAGFEWLYRLIKRPKRHWGRIKNVFRFLLIVIRQN